MLVSFYYTCFGSHLKSQDVLLFFTLRMKFIKGKCRNFTEYIPMYQNCMKVGICVMWKSTERRDIWRFYICGSEDYSFLRYDDVFIGNLWRFEGSCYFHTQASRLAWKWRLTAPPKCWWQISNNRGVTYGKTQIFKIFKAVETFIF